MHTQIRLFGRPCVERDGLVAPAPRGQKTWVLLAMLVLAHRPISRAWAAEMLFGAAADPRGALRWAVAELRRKLGDAATLDGDPLIVRFAPRTGVDVVDAVPQNVLGLLVDGRLPTLLEGADLADLPEAACWLTRNREACRRSLVTQLTVAVESNLTAGSVDDAVTGAHALVEDDPLEESRHLLLVRALVASGDRSGALAAVRRCDAVLTRELGVTVSPVLTAAASAPFRAPVDLIDRDRILSRTLLEVARSAMASGAVQVGLAQLAEAEAAAHRSRDDLAVVEVLFARGSAIVHAVGTNDPQGLHALRRSAALAVAGGWPSAAAPALRELAFSRAAARRPVSELLARAEALAVDDTSELAAIRGIRGFAAVDDGRYATALSDFTESMRLAERAGAGRQLAWSWTLRARTHLQRGELAAASDDLAGSASLVHELRWTAFLPFVQSQQAMLALRENRLDDAAALIASGWTTATLSGDRCWLSLLGQVAGLVAACRGSAQEAMTVLSDAYSGQASAVDRCRWIDAALLDSLVSVAARADVPRAVRAAGRLAEVAERDRMPEYAARAAAWQVRLGNQEARARARVALDHVDNPSLVHLIGP